MKTLPSGGALATEAAAISPLAPARFSTTTERFSRSPMPGATMRASRSFGSAGRKADDEAQRTIGKIRRLGAGGADGQRQGSESPASAERRREHDHWRLC